MEVRFASRVDRQIRKELTSNMILAGGGACLKGLSERLDYELGKQFNAVEMQKVVNDRASSRSCTPQSRSIVHIMHGQEVPL